MIIAKVDFLKKKINFKIIGISGHNISVRVENKHGNILITSYESPKS